MNKELVPLKGELYNISDTTGWKILIDSLYDTTWFPVVDILFNLRDSIVEDIKSSVVKS